MTGPHNTGRRRDGLASGSWEVDLLEDRTYPPFRGALAGKDMRNRLRFGKISSDLFVEKTSLVCTGTSGCCRMSHEDVRGTIVVVFAVVGEVAGEENAVCV